ncbi:hypothetical protein like AT2G31240 [Hibiscus trionum]|uniref:Uncharacterized protein n=1 Tax=Hibiscus trionum TaxID=183268 RepID=A0A9W7MXK4_HIBTR|nr:hypothetical protein like AT2G31240 [Hibiscus trionum]
MKKASILLFSSLNRRGLRSAAPLLSRDYSQSTFSSSSSPIHSTGLRLIQSPVKTHEPFQTISFRNLGTSAENPKQSFSKPREKSELVEAFEAAKTTEEMISLFEEMEAMEGCFDKRELGIAALKIGRKLERGGAYPKKFSPFAMKALNSLREYGELSLPVAMAFQLLGYYFVRVEISDHMDIVSLDSAVKVLEFVKNEGVSAEDLRVMHPALQEELISVDEATRFENWDEVLKCWGIGSESIRAKIIAAHKQIESGKYDQAIYDLTPIVEQAEEDSVDRALAVVLMGKALFRRGNLDDSSKWFEIASIILDKKATAFPVEVYTSYREMIKLHESPPPPLKHKEIALQAILKVRRELTHIYYRYGPY